MDALITQRSQVQILPPLLTKRVTDPQLSHPSDFVLREHGEDTAKVYCRSFNGSEG
jgi:hypothetical protein